MGLPCGLTAKVKINITDEQGVLPEVAATTKTRRLKKPKREYTGTSSGFSLFKRKKGTS